MAGNEDEVIIKDDDLQPVEVEIEEEAGDEDADGKKVDAAPKVEARKEEPEGDPDEELLEQRRKERRERKERQREAKERNQAELAQLRAESAQLRAEVADLKKRTLTTETGTKLAKAMQDLSVVESVIAKAVEDGDGKKHVEALRLRDMVAAEIHHLQGQSAQAPQPTPGQKPAPQKPQVAPEVIGHFQKFCEAHPDYNKDGDYTRAVQALDAAVAADGYDPKTQDYWDELADRVGRTFGRKVVPPSAPAAPAARGGPQVGSGRSQVMPGRQSYSLTPAHLQAIRDAGKDDSDPAVRAHYAKMFRKYERENAAT